MGHIKETKLMYKNLRQSRSLCLLLKISNQKQTEVFRIPESMSKGLQVGKLGEA